jgi:hypothetical protein
VLHPYAYEALMDTCAKYIVYSPLGPCDQFTLFGIVIRRAP